MTTQPTHTQGPWSLIRIDSGAPWNIGTIDHDIAIAQQIQGDNIKGSIRSANARLIAAAPELLEIARACLESRRTMSMERKSEIRSMAASAIAKAEGKNA